MWVSIVLHIKAGTNKDTLSTYPAEYTLVSWQATLDTMSVCFFEVKPKQRIKDLELLKIKSYIILVQLPMKIFCETLKKNSSAFFINGFAF